jgi:hypothetical protein
MRKMKWITEQEVKEAARQGLVPALRWSYRHWCQICDASEEEYNRARDCGDVSVSDRFCALCKRYLKCGEGTKEPCPLFTPPHRWPSRHCANSLWIDVAEAEDDDNWPRLQQAARALRDRIFEVLMEHVSKKEAPKEEPKKPELRHGDYGISGGQKRRYTHIAILRKFGKPEIDVFFSDGGRSMSTDRINDDIVWLGNIFSDLSGLGEDLEEFQLSNDHNVRVYLYTYAESHPIQFEGKFGLTLDQAEQLVLNLRRLIATARRRKC